MRRLILAAGVALGTLVGLVVPADAADLDIGGPATPAPALRADRGVQWREGATCDLLTVDALADKHPDVGQFVVLSTSTFGATFGDAFVARRAGDGSWMCQTSTVTARFGRNGTRPLVLRRSGDGTTPAGVFPLGATTAWDGMTFSVFGNRADPGVRDGIGYRSVRPDDCWAATPHRPDYNTLIAEYGCLGPDDEWLPRFGDVYSHAAVIGANMDPISGNAPDETAYASAIFLHRHSYATPGAASGTTKPTSGCVSVAYPDLVSIIRLLDPAATPHFAIGPTAWLRGG